MENIEQRVKKIVAEQLGVKRQRPAGPNKADFNGERNH